MTASRARRSPGTSGRAGLVRECVAYYDGRNFAARVEVPTFVYLGLSDDVCPPQTGFALCRALLAPKRSTRTPGPAHHAGLHWVMPKAKDFLANHLSPEAL